jgi:hypothetical protein
MLAVSTAASAEPIAVQTPEAPIYGVLSLSAVNGAVLAHGELVQTLTRDGVQSRLTFRFRDGSLYDEVTTFTQAKVFRVVAYRLVQRGPAFPHAMEAQFDRASGRYNVRSRERDAQRDETAEGSLELPEDVSNGMISILLKNLRGGSGGGHMVAFTPKPRLLRMELLPDGEESFYVGSAARSASRYLVKLDLPGLIGLVATVVGKEPPSLRYWVSLRPVPAFLKVEAPFFLNGPIWRVEMSRAQWKPE